MLNVENRNKQEMLTLFGRCTRTNIRFILLNELEKKVLPVPTNTARVECSYDDTRLKYENKAIIFKRIFH